MMKDNRLLPKTNGVVKEMNVFEGAPLKPVTFRLTFPFRLWYACCLGVCRKSAIRKMDLERNRCLLKGMTSFPLQTTHWLPNSWSFSKCWSSTAHAFISAPSPRGKMCVVRPRCFSPWCQYRGKTIEEFRQISLPFWGVK